VEHALRQCKHNLRVALIMLKRDLSAKAARKKLVESKGNLRRAIGE
jgi:N-acetylmuramic acid 6-phosphate (MurNAc-6-P) etherase